MAYIYDGSGYRAGAAGVQADLDLRQYYAQQAAQALSSGQAYSTEDQIERARGDLNPVSNYYQHLMLNGLYSPQEQAAITSARVNEVNNATRAMQQNLNAAMASRGQGGNAGAQAALSMAGQFAGAGQRGQARAGVIEANKQGQLAGLQGYADTQRAMSALAAAPTRMDIDENDYMSMYDQWRNAQVGYDGAKWGSEPDQPDFYNEPVAGEGKKKKHALFGVRI